MCVDSILLKLENQLRSEDFDTAAFSRQFVQNPFSHLFRYEQCPIEFISLPGDGQSYLMFDRESGCLCGTFDAAKPPDSAALERSFSSLLVADHWDFGKMLPKLWEKDWAHVYFVLNDCASRFFSFFKLPGFRDMLPERVSIFESTEKMVEYFSESGQYLPREIHAPNRAAYAERLKEIHGQRLQSSRTGKPFFSVCLPTYNRGELALRAVESVLASEYDFEIEVVVSNNGSLLGQEGYRTIQAIPDSRVLYYEFETNMGMAANICRCLEKARGDYAFFLSDEDLLNVERLKEAFDYLCRSKNLGCCIFDSDNDLEHEVKKKRPALTYKNGPDAVGFACRRAGHLAGVCFDLRLLRQFELLNQVKQFQGTNIYFDFWAHTVLAVLLAEKKDLAMVDIELWHFGDSSDIDDFEHESGVRKAHFPEPVMEQETAAMEIVKQFFTGECLQAAFVQQIGHAFGLLTWTYYDIGDHLKKLYSWRDICELHYKNCMNILVSLSLTPEEAQAMTAKIDEEFFNWLDCRKIRKWFSPEENLKATLRAQVVRHFYDGGTPFWNIDFQQIDDNLDRCLDLLSGTLG